MKWVSMKLKNFPIKIYYFTTTEKCLKENLKILALDYFS